MTGRNKRRVGTMSEIDLKSIFEGCDCFMTTIVVISACTWSAREDLNGHEGSCTEYQRGHWESSYSQAEKMPPGHRLVGEALEHL